MSKLPFALCLAVCLPALAQEPVTTVQPPGAEATPYYPIAPGFPGDVATPAPTPSAAPADTPVVEEMSGSPAQTVTSSTEETLAPTWDTQKQSRTYILQIPAPRGQITDSQGRPLAQSRVGYNLALTFPIAPPMSDAEALAFAREQIALAQTLLDTEMDVPDSAILKHYHNRALLPMDIAADLLPSQIATIRQEAPEHLVLDPAYERFYPNGPLAGQIIGYAGRNGRVLDGPVEDNEVLWPAAQGREGLEQTFDSELAGKNGQLNLAFDSTGQKASERVVIPPQPGDNVVTTLDEDVQRITEQALDKGAKRGAIVIVDATNGDIVAMASKPCYNPNEFVPTISPEAYRTLDADPDKPLLPRAYRSAYPPGSTFKIPVGLAALESGAISLTDEFPGPPSIEVGGITFHNWKKTDAGMINFVDAFTQSCDTWFYQVGIKTGAPPIITWAEKMGFGVQTGIPLASEAEGRVPTEEYMERIYGRKFMSGDLANFSIGQGDLLVTPLQMAEAMAAIANGGTLYRARLVQQVQTYNDQIVTAYNVNARVSLGIDPKIMAALKQAMINVVNSPMGTAGKAAIDEVQIAGKTGTAQWGPKAHERDAAWFVGFCPADNPKYAFAALYEGEAGESTHGGTYAAPMIADIMKQLFKPEPKPKRGAAVAKRKAPGPVQTETNDR
jgi:penicillin-binding protein 2